MKFIADENIDLPIINRLREENLNVLSVYESHRGIADDDVLNVANSENAVLLTIDKDFGELVFRKKMISSGVVLIRLAGLPNKDKAEIVTSVIKAHHNELYKAFTVITSESIRIRKFDM